MTFDEAMKLLDGCTAQFSGTRQDHILLQQAIAVVRKGPEKVEKVEEVKEETKAEDS